MHVPWYEDYFTADYWSYADAEYSTERTSTEVSYLAQVLDQHAPGRRVPDLGCGVMVRLFARQELARDG
jgi:hypothetical protein